MVQNYEVIKKAFCYVPLQFTLHATDIINNLPRMQDTLSSYA